MIEMDAKAMSELPRFISMARRLSAPGQVTQAVSLPDAVPSPFSPPERTGSDRWMGRLRRFVRSSAGARGLELA